MEINKKIVFLISILSFFIVMFVDYINITRFIDYNAHLDSIISNTITFISILIGFISSIYVMMQQVQKSYVLELLRKYDLLKDFNKSFKVLIYTGFFDVLVLIFMNFAASNIMVFKIIVYIAAPITTFFLLSSFNIIITICKMISAEEELKMRDRKIDDEDIVI